jgi:hypothetical protein
MYICIVLKNTIFNNNLKFLDKMSKQKEQQQEEQETQTVELAESPIMYIEGMPMAWHSNMSTGTFAPFGNTDKSVRKMRINLVAMRCFENAMYLKKNDQDEETKKLMTELKISEQEAKEMAISNSKKQWIELFFIKDFDLDKKNPLCVMLVKTYSLANFQKQLKEFAYECLPDGSLCGFTNIEMEVTTDKIKRGSNDFHQTLFKGKVTEEKYSAVIQDFLATEPIIYDTNNLEENLRFPQTYNLHASKCRNIAIPADFKESAFLLGQNPQKLLAETEAEPTNTDTQTL